MSDNTTYGCQQITFEPYIFSVLNKSSRMSGRAMMLGHIDAYDIIFLGNQYCVFLNLYSYSKMSIIGNESMKAVELAKMHVSSFPYTQIFSGDPMFDTLNALLSIVEPNGIYIRQVGGITALAVLVTQKDVNFIMEFVLLENKWSSEQFIEEFKASLRIDKNK